MGIIGQGGKNVEEKLETSRVPRLVTGVCSRMGSSQFRGSWKTGLDVGVSDGRCRGLRHGHGMVVRRQGRQGLELKARGRVFAHTALTEPWLHHSPELALPHLSFGVGHWKRSRWLWLAAQDFCPAWCCI